MGEYNEECLKTFLVCCRYIMQDIHASPLFIILNLMTDKIIFIRPLVSYYPCKLTHGNHSL